MDKKQKTKETTSFEKKYEIVYIIYLKYYMFCPYLMRENWLFPSLVKKDFKVFLNIVMVFISFMLTGSMFHAFIAD